MHSFPDVICPVQPILGSCEKSRELWTEGTIITIMYKN